MKLLVGGEVVLLAVAMAAGCGPGRPPPLGEVEGRVVLDGEPLANARIVFQPLPAGRASQGMTEASGRYRLVYLRELPGAMVGRHEVRITTGDETVPAERLPDRYHAATVLQADVVRGPNRIDFDLQAAEAPP
jgi:hypothetical protein